MKKYILLLATIFIAATTQQVCAQWEKIQALPAAYCVFVAPNGNLISSDFQYTEYSGGIYYSEDKGETWIKSDAPDYLYSAIIQADEYIIASGENCYLARSKDNGVTWEMLNYAYILYDYLEEEAVEGDVAYAITYFKDKLFIADMNGGGVLYSEDFGETWTMTDRASLMYETDYGSAIDSFYKLDQNNGRLLLFGAFFAYRLNEENYTWENIINGTNNFMGVSTTCGDKLICGRAIPNYTDKVNFLEYTTDAGDTWNAIPRPTGIIDNNVRALYSYDNNLIVALQNGGMYFTDNLGETWTDISQGIPYYINDVDNSKVYKSPLVIDADENYIYIALYDEHWNGNNVGGIYRYDKSLLQSAVVNTFDNNIRIAYDNNSLCFNTPGDVVIYNINGTTVLNANNCQEVNIANLQEGIYIYQVNIGNDVVTGKFIKQ